MGEGGVTPNLTWFRESLMVGKTEWRESEVLSWWFG